ncbi:MAG: glycosyltransferase [Gemmatimonadaceae bacterium]
MNEHLPFCSVVMPAHQASSLLPRTLGALAASDYPRERFEIIVVDDASADDSASVAARYADTVIRLPGNPHGPAYARNRGFEVSRGEIVMFFDSDVVVHNDTVRRFVEVLMERPEIGSVFGSYDDAPTDRGFMSQYRNLLHHYTHHRNPGEVETFWAGAGAIRRDVFEEAGMYDEWHFPRPQIEDIELGARVRAIGARILLVPEIQVTHLKRWTFFGVVRTDLRDRGIPWARLLAHRKTMISTTALNLRWSEKLNTFLVWLGLLLIGVALFERSWLIFGVALVCPLIATLMNFPLLRFFLRIRGFIFMLRVIPVHLLYYLLNGISFGMGVLLQQTIGAPIPNPTMEAYAEMGVQRWPPVPTKQRRSSWTADTE